MKKFNNSDLFTGYLKQLLKDFNLPKIKVYTKAYQQYFDKIGKECGEILSTIPHQPKSVKPGVKAENLNTHCFPYIRNGEIQEYINKKWVNIGRTQGTFPKDYTYNRKILNYTKNLKINSNVYDSYTHEYLGDYLRFHRDYSNINLMSLYNCFSNRACEKLSLNWTIKKAKNDGSVITHEVSFDTSDPSYKIYMLPVKLFQTYTIAIDSDTPIELCCGIYGDYQDTRAKFQNIPMNTYKRISSSKFSQPFLYTELAYTGVFTETKEKDTFIENLSNEAKIEIAQNECDLKLFIKVPQYNTSTIVVLEGNYLSWNDSVVTVLPDGTIDKKMNKTIINFDSPILKNVNEEQLRLISPLQLLMFNTKEQHPFADRLIEYLLGNAITNSEEELYDNVLRAQKALDSNRETTKYKIGVPGVWSPEMNIVFYEAMTNSKTDFEINHDILGYVDKDVEKYYKVKLSEDSSVSLINFELEGDFN